jgi:hypothetical protein
MLIQVLRARGRCARYMLNSFGATSKAYSRRHEPRARILLRYSGWLCYFPASSGTVRSGYSRHSQKADHGHKGHERQGAYNDEELVHVIKVKDRCS